MDAKTFVAAVHPGTFYFHSLPHFCLHFSGLLEQNVKVATDNLKFEIQPFVLA